jgi:hypothetical protein
LLEIKDSNDGAAFQNFTDRRKTMMSVAVFEVFVSQDNAKIITTVAKSVYSCKNIMKRGKKRELVRKYIAKQSKPNNEAKKFLINLEIKLLRINFFDFDVFKDEEIKLNKN